CPYGIYCPHQVQSKSNIPDQGSPPKPQKRGGQKNHFRPTGQSGRTVDGSYTYYQSFYSKRRTCSNYPIQGKKIQPKLQNYQATRRYRNTPGGIDKRKKRLGQ